MRSLTIVVNEKIKETADYFLAVSNRLYKIESFPYVDELGEKYAILNESFKPEDFEFVSNPESDELRYNLSRVYWPTFDIKTADINYDFSDVSSRSINIFENKSTDSVVMLFNLKRDGDTPPWLRK